MSDHLNTASEEKLLSLEREIKICFAIVTGFASLENLVKISAKNSMEQSTHTHTQSFMKPLH